MFVILNLFVLIALSISYESIFDISSLGYEFVPADSSYPAISILSSKKILYCSAACNQRQDCRTFDYDSETKECRLWDVDTMTSGSIVLSSSKNRSSVGSVRFLENIYLKRHNESCDRCIQNRYSICNSNTSQCQCPSKTYWNGSICLAKLLYNQICSSHEVCRSDLNLTCEPSCDVNYRCLNQPNIGIGQTVAGYCNMTASGDSIGLNSPWGIYISPYNGIMYVSNTYPAKVQAYPLFSRTGYIYRSTDIQVISGITSDSSNTIYMADRSTNNGVVFIQREGINIGTIPPWGVSNTSCTLTGLSHPVGIAIDRFHNAYIGLSACCCVMKWPLNATSGTVIAGQMLNCQRTNDLLTFSGFIYLDEDRNALFVTDRDSHRIQRFILGGNGTSGSALNQLNSPRGICVTRDGQTIYIADAYNNRVMKWIIGQTQGSVVIGNENGTSGSTSQTLNTPISVAVDPTETYLYVTDAYNNRVQRVRIK